MACRRLLKSWAIPPGKLADRLHALRLPKALLGLGLAGKGLVELGVLHLELVDELQCLVTPPHCEVEGSRNHQGGDEADQERDPGQVIRQESAETRPESDQDDEDGDAIGLDDLNSVAEPTLSRMGTSLTAGSP